MLTMGNEDNQSDNENLAHAYITKNTDDEDEDDEDDSDVEKSDSSFADRIDNIINYDDIDQNLKGDNINYIGQINGLGKDK